LLSNVVCSCRHSDFSFHNKDNLFFRLSFALHII